ncbi:MAG: dTDP-glucose 4,6-dehydratase [Succinivibrio sp.]|nr:dTDP-glucose 4,6-dehydratase [Succinivibrio sp.]
MRLLVTGGCGFIGSHFVRLILNDHPEEEVINLDALTYAGNPDNVADVAFNPRYHFVKGNICDHDLVRELVKECDVVVNFAAESHVDRSINDPSPFITTNVQGTCNLLEACREIGIERYLQISTDEVYGSLGPEETFTEESPLAPNSPYAASKASADLLVRAYHQTYGLPTLITRCSNNYGPNQHPEKLIPSFILRLNRGEHVPIYGDGTNVRDWIYVTDHCRAVDLVLRKGKIGEIYNVSAHQELSNLEITRILLNMPPYLSFSGLMPRPPLQF